MDCSNPSTKATLSVPCIFVFLIVCTLFHPIYTFAQIGFVGNMRAQLNNSGDFRGTGTAMEFGALKIQVEVYKDAWTGITFDKNGADIDCKLLVRKASSSFDPSYDATVCKANPWLDNTYAEQQSPSNSFNGGGLTMTFIGYTGNNDIYEYDLQNIPPGRYSYECRCDDYTDNVSFSGTWDYAGCGDEDGDGTADGELDYFTVGHEGVFRQILVAKTFVGLAEPVYFFDEAFQPGNAPIANWEIAGTGANGALCQNDPFFLGFEINTYKNTTLEGDILGADFIWSVTSATANDVTEQISPIDFRDNCNDLLSTFSGGGSCQGDVNGVGIGNGTDLIQDQRWQLSPDNPAAVSRYPDAGGFVDVKEAILDANNGDFPEGSYTITFRTDVSSSLGTLTGNVLSKDFVISSETGCVPEPLPIELVRFSGKKLNRNVLLNWSTSMEVNNDHFDIERSSDGNRFSKIGEHKAAGNTTIGHSYDFVDPHPMRQMNYYRLKQIDFDGKFDYSPIVSVDMTPSDQFVSGIFPNPVTDELTILFETDNEAIFEVAYALFSVDNRLIAEGTISSLDPKLDCSLLSAGAYFIRMTRTLNGHSYQSTVKLIK